MNQLTLVSLASLFGLAAVAKSPTPRPLTPSRGHYKQLKAFSPSPKSPAADLDKQRFFTDGATIEGRLRLKPVYLLQTTVADFKLPHPPANSSEQTRAELNYLLALQRNRSPEDVRASLHMAKVYFDLRVKPGDSNHASNRRNLFQIGRSIGSWFNPESLPITAEFLARVWRDASHFVWALKFQHARVRPVAIDPSIKNLESTDWPAYPSGHAAFSYIFAYLFQELAPPFTDVFVKDAHDMAHSRELIGVHFPSDSEAGRLFARQFVNLLFANKQWLADFEDVKKEWTASAREDFR